MAKILYVGTHGTDNPTKAGLVFTAANGAKEAGHKPTVALLGDATYLMKDTIAANTSPVGWPPIKELIAIAVANGTPIHI